MKIFLFYFEMAIKITGSAQNYRVGRVSGNFYFFRPNFKYHIRHSKRTVRLSFSN